MASELHLKRKSHQIIPITRGRPAIVHLSMVQYNINQSLLSMVEYNINQSLLSMVEYNINQSLLIIYEIGRQ